MLQGKLIPSWKSFSLLSVRLRFNSPTELAFALKRIAGSDFSISQLEQGRIDGVLTANPMSVGAMVSIMCNRALFIHGERRSLPFAITTGIGITFQGIQARVRHLCGFMAGPDTTNCYLPAGVALETMLLPPDWVNQQLQGQERLQNALNTTSQVSLCEESFNTLAGLYKAGLSGGEVSATDLLIEWERAVVGGNETIDFDPYDRHALVRAVDFIAENLHDPLLTGQDVAKAALTHEGNLRKLFQRYGTSPMAFARHMKLAQLGRFARSEEGMQMTQQQLANRFGYGKAKHMAACFYQEFGQRLGDVQRGQGELVLQ